MRRRMSEPAPSTAAHGHAPRPPDPWPDTLGALLRHAAERWPTRPALEAGPRVWRYEELSARVDAAAGLLAARGVAPGDRIAVALGNGPAHLAVPFVCSRLGISALLLSTSLPAGRWREQLRRADPRLVLADRAHAAELGGCGVEVHEIDGDDPGLGAGPVPPASVAAAGHDPASTVLYLATSGTTGGPKLTRLTERGLLHAARGYLPRMPLEEGERSLVLLPLHYIGPISTQSVLMPLLGGCSVIAGDTRPGPVADRLAADPVTHVDAAPAWLTRLVPRLTQPPRAWRTVVYGGAPMPPATAGALAERVPGLGLYDVWGLSEAHGPVTLLRHDPTDPPPAGTVGTPLPGIAVRALAQGARPGDAGPPAGRETGELWVGGPTVTPGYLDDPEATAAALCDGWLATGDLGAVEADGTVRLLGRRKDVILRGGVNVVGSEVERVLGRVPGVAEAAVVPVADATAGEVVGAAVVAGADAVDPGTLRRAVREQLGTAAVPRHVRFLAELPRNPVGKVDKPSLARAFEERAPGPRGDG